jgi:hypothetical protein
MFFLRSVRRSAKVLGIPFTPRFQLNVWAIGIDDLRLMIGY